MSNYKLTVAVCGGGLAGVTAAIALSRLSSERKDIQINIYESAQEFTEIGAGIGMLLRPWKIMKRLGIDGPLRKVVNIPDKEDELRDTFELRKSDQAEGISFYDIKVPFGGPTFHRAVLLQCFVDQIDHEVTNIHFGKRLVSFELPSESHKTSPIKINFKDGTSAECDVLIGADGIHSSTRHSMLDLAAQEKEMDGSEEGKASAETLRSMKNPIWSGAVAHRSLISAEELRKINPKHGVLDMSRNYMGKDKHIIAMPIKSRGVINVVAFCMQPQMEGVPFEGKMSESSVLSEILDQYEGWEEEVQQILRCLRAPSKWSICTLKELPIYTFDRIALIGDAAHAMTPHQGSGAGQAFEDAYILAALLAHPLTTVDTIHIALKVYEAIRLPHATFVMRQSRRNGQLYEFLHPNYTSLNKEITSPEQLSELGPAIMDGWNWAWDTDAEDDKLRAIKMYEERLKGVN